MSTNIMLLNIFIYIILVCLNIYLIKKCANHNLFENLSDFVFGLSFSFLPFINFFVIFLYIYCILESIYKDDNANDIVKKILNFKWLKRKK